MERLIATMLLCLGSCTVSQFSPDLDTVLTEGGREYLEGMGANKLGENALVLAEQSLAGPQLIFTNGDVRIENTKYNVLGLALPSVITLGIIPMSLSGWFEQTVEIEKERGEIVETITVVRTSSYTGWAACLIGISPNWEYKSLPGEEELKRRAFITTINRLADTVNRKENVR